MLAPLQYELEERERKEILRDFREKGDSLPERKEKRREDQRGQTSKDGGKGRESWEDKDTKGSKERLGRQERR